MKRLDGQAIWRIAVESHALTLTQRRGREGGQGQCQCTVSVNVSVGVSVNVNVNRSVTVTVTVRPTSCQCHGHSPPSTAHGQCIPSTTHGTPDPVVPRPAGIAALAHQTPRPRPRSVRRLCRSSAAVAPTPPRRRSLLITAMVEYRPSCRCLIPSTDDGGASTQPLHPTRKQQRSSPALLHPLTLSALHRQ